jgi:Tfp pilus assembly protein PilO
LIQLQHQRLWIVRVQLTLAGVTLCGLAAFFLFVYRPGAVRVRELKTETSAIEFQLARNEEAAKDLNKIKADVLRLRDQFTRSRQLPPQQDLPKFLRDIDQLSQASKLQKFRSEPEAQRKQELCSELPISLMFQGNFPDVASFLRQAEEMPRMTRTRRLLLKSRDGKTGSVDVQLSMSIFFSEGQ